MNPLSVILHCDLDCFYAQVERERLGLPKDASVAVIQWSSALAVSYPARQYGIKRGSTVDDIKRLAPNDEVKIVYVETISSDAKAVDSEAATTSAPSAPTQSKVPNPQLEKVSLARYRRASARVFDALNSAILKLHSKTVLERASIDEAYIDVTAEVDRRIRQGMPTPPLSNDTHLEGHSPPPALGDDERGDDETGNDMIATDGDMTGGMPPDGYTRLAHGASIAKQLREHIASQCGYTMSAGVSVNKLVAKFASAANKPDQQTVVPVAAISKLLEDVPLTRIRGLGGKLGREISFALNGYDETKRDEVVTAGETRRLSVDGLQRVLKCEPKTATFVYRSVRGLDDSLVTKRDAPRSLLAAKSFSPEKDLAKVRVDWLPLLASELAARIEEDGRIANNLTISFRATLNGGHPFVQASRVVRMPAASAVDHSFVNAIIEAAFNTLKNVLFKEDRFKLPLNFIGLTATNFVQRAPEKEQISQFFAKSENGKASQPKRSFAPTQPALSQNVELNMESDEKLVHSELGGQVLDEKQMRKKQEKIDREVALKLHREESIISLQNVPKSQAEPTQPAVSLRRIPSFPNASQRPEEPRKRTPTKQHRSQMELECGSPSVKNDAGPNTVPLSTSTPLSASRAEDHQRRLQEKADRDFALKLHREEATRGIKKTQKPKAGRAPAKSVKPAQSNGPNNRDINGVRKIDRFFRTAPK